jgi:hypothetical protein
MDHEIAGSRETATMRLMLLLHPNLIQRERLFHQGLSKPYRHDGLTVYPAEEDE